MHDDGLQRPFPLTPFPLAVEFQVALTSAADTVPFLMLADASLSGPPRRYDAEVPLPKLTSLSGLPQSMGAFLDSQLFKDSFSL